MSIPANPEATELGETRKIFDRRFSGRPQRDLTNTGEVFRLAADIAEREDARTITGLSTHEIRAIAQLAAGAGVILHCAIELVDASDRNLPTSEVRRRLNALCDATRELTVKELKQ